jgi:hemoglobin-like flavoprotein
MQQIVMALVNPEDIELVNDSLERCTPQAEFFEQFYCRFRDSSDEVAAKFSGTDAKVQARALRTAFLLLLQAVAGDPSAWQQLELRAVRHDRKHLDIKPEMYELWRDCLLATIRDFDSRADDRTERAWRRVVQQAIDFMTARY